MSDPRTYGTSPAGMPARNESPSSAPVPKVIASTVGGALGGALAILLIGILKRNGVELSPDESMALTTIIGAIVSAAGAFIAGYLTPPQGFGGPDAGTTGRIGAIMLALVLASAMTACSSVQSITGVEVPQPQTARQSYVVAEEAYQSALRTADRLLDAGTISTPQQKAKLAGLVKKGSASMDAANEAVRVGATDQVAVLQAANAALAELIQYLRAQEAAKTGPPAARR